MCFTPPPSTTITNHRYYSHTDRQVFGDPAPAEVDHKSELKTTAKNPLAWLETNLVRHLA